MDSTSFWKLTIIFISGPTEEPNGVRLREKSINFTTQAHWQPQGLLSSEWTMAEMLCLAILQLDALNERLADYACIGPLISTCAITKHQFVTPNGRLRPQAVYHYFLLIIHFFRRRLPMALYQPLVAQTDSASIAPATARHLELPDSAFSYLHSHGELDKSCVEFFTRLMNEVTQPQDQTAIIHAAQMVYPLYAEMLAEVAGVY